MTDPYELPLCGTKGHTPSDLPEFSDDEDGSERCKYCGEEITWTGPSDYDWQLSE